MVTNLTDNAITILKRRYLQPGESPEQMWWRVATAVAQGETTQDAHMYWAQMFNKMMSNLEFLPNSPTLMNAGTGQGSLSACYVLIPDDNMESIMQVQTDMVMIHKWGGGTGFGFSRLRPKGAPIYTTQGHAMGPVAVLKGYSVWGDIITQGGKRNGANMGMLHVDHADIREFIHMKDDGVTAQNFNISVLATDEFMAVASQTESESQRLLWEIAESAWRTGDPGLGFIDQVNRTRPDGIEVIEASNPCVTGDTLIATVYDGPKTFKELADEGKDTQVYAWHPETKLPVIKWMRKPHLTRRNAPVLKVTFDSGLEVWCTYNHSFYTFRGHKVEAQNLTVGQSVRAFSTSIHKDGHMRAHGWADNKAQHQWVARMVWENAGYVCPPGHVVHHKDGDKLNNTIENLELLSVTEHNQKHYPTRYENGFKGREDFYDVVVAARDQKGVEWNHRVTNIEMDGIADVYNGMVEDAHTYIILDPNSTDYQMAGVISANCGEEYLENYGNCCLGSIDVAKFIEDGQFDWRRLEWTIKVAVRFLNNVIEVNEFPVPRLRETNLESRRVGLGIMGWHDALLKMRIPYDAPEAIELANNFMKQFTEIAWTYSNELTNERATRSNASVTTIAPTGTISMIAGCSSGIEPVFAWESVKNVLDGERLIERHPLRQQAITEGWEKDDGSLWKAARDIPWRTHVEMQAAFQKHTTNSVSKTINIHRGASVKDVFDAYVLAWKMGCKGITVYRDGSRAGQVYEDV